MGYEKYEAGTLGDDADVMDWMGVYDNFRLYQVRIEMLRSVVEE